jgi:hypothetical protein
MSEKNVKNSVLTEETVVAKVKDLLETLDHIKRYNALARSLKKFAAITVASIAVFISLGVLLAFSGVDQTLSKPATFIVGFLLLLIPVAGLVTGILYVRRRVNAVKTGESSLELAHGFPAALEVLTKLDWDETFNEILNGRLSYVLYGLLKTGMYWFVTFSALSIIVNASALYFFQRLIGGNFVLGLLALFIVLLFLGKDLLRRYKEVQSLDMLLWELRWFSFELRRAEFQT